MLGLFVLTARVSVERGFICKITESGHVHGLYLHRPTELRAPSRANKQEAAHVHSCQKDIKLSLSERQCRRRSVRYGHIGDLGCDRRRRSGEDQRGPQGSICDIKKTTKEQKTKKGRNGHESKGEKEAHLST